MAQSNTKSGIRIWWDESVQAYRLVTPYRPDFVELLKQLIPASDRAWDADTKTWTITEKMLGPTKDLAERIFKTNSVVITRQMAQQAQGAGPSGESNPRSGRDSAGVRKGEASPIGKLIEEWFQLLPYEAAKKAYREGALQLHPDRGGSLETMSRFNSLWQQIEKLHFLKEK
jgi:hypothetical protein